MNDQDREEIGEILTKIMDERADAFHVPDKKHFLDHEQLTSCREHKEDWADNHEFVSAIRKNKEAIENAGLKFFVFAVCSSILGFLGWVFDIFKFKTGG